MTTYGADSNPPQSLDAETSRADRGARKPSPSARQPVVVNGKLAGWCSRTIDLSNAPHRRPRRPTNSGGHQEREPWDFTDCFCVPVDGPVAMFSQKGSDRLVIALFPSAPITDAGIGQWRAKLRRALDGLGEYPADGIAVHSIPGLDSEDQLRKFVATIRAELRRAGVGR